MKLLIILSFLFIGCASDNSDGLKQDLDQVYIGSGIEQYYMPDLPSWANMSSAAKCKRLEPIRYLNFSDMHKSYSFSYEQLIQFQFMLNRKFYSYKKSTGREAVYLKDESYIMHNVHQQIIGGSRDFIAPKFNRINLIWIDKALTNDMELKKLKKLMYSEDMEKGHPVFISMCLSSIELEQFISKSDYTKFGVKGISQSMFSPFNDKFELGAQFSLHLDKLLPNKDLYIYVPFMPEEFKGVTKIKKIK
jgi:hypothetical protein